MTLNVISKFRVKQNKPMFYSEKFELQILIAFLNYVPYHETHQSMNSWGHNQRFCNKPELITQIKPYKWLVESFFLTVYT